MTDAERARELGLRFYVATKEKQGARWSTFFESGDLEEALRAGREKSAFEVAVFVATASGGFVYWTSRSPDVFNASVLVRDGI
ncbi:hypothetical protein D7X55_01765 [Corallococcus sp. AB049A]|uniref:hypothetical protein n=1 Tax=Corallococcus sp. AB049A TaxID=2316721 RepID=UPI000EE8E68C|nr:hypothetical protein [Corallococcus sp. AB049A]RKI74681.1 hypothetical protein D7X55_01765 [Corallococcus sp. AB049A]